MALLRVFLHLAETEAGGLRRSALELRIRVCYDRTPHMYQQDQRQSKLFSPVSSRQDHVKASARCQHSCAFVCRGIGCGVSQFLPKLTLRERVAIRRARTQDRHQMSNKRL